MNIIVITCECGHAFSATLSEYVDAEWKLQEAYYKAQGCLVERREDTNFENCDCDHRKGLEHNFQDLIESVKEQE